MGIFNKIFNSATEEDEKSDIGWISLTNLEQLDRIVEDSKTKSQVIFKHSTRCGISRVVLRQFEKQYPFTSEEVDLYYLDLLNHRDVSNEIASHYHVYHESPQLLIIKDGQVIKHASHESINSLTLSDLI